MLPDSLLTQESRVFAAPPKLSGIYDAYSWAAHSLKARAWLQAALVFNLFLMPFDYLLNPSLLTATLVIRGLIVSAILLGLYMLWGRQRANWLQGASLLVLALTIMLEAGALGAMGGVHLFERYSTAGLFTFATAILFFPIQFRWTIAAVVAAVALHAGMIVFGPVADPLLALAVSCFYSGAILTFATTRKATLKSQWSSFRSKIRELRDQESLAQLFSELQLVANLDPLTGIQNRRSTQEDIDRLWSSSDDDRPPMAFLMIDIDNFKNLNDSLGHAAGDECIKTVADTIRNIVPGGDIVSRYGGEEFLVVLTHITASGALAVAEQIRKSVASLKLENPGNPGTCKVTVSIGMALLEDDQTPDMLMRRADEALYNAKHNGKNQTVVAPPPDGIGPRSARPGKQPDPRNVA